MLIEIAKAARIKNVVGAEDRDSIDKINVAASDIIHKK